MGVLYLLLRGNSTEFNYRDIIERQSYQAAGVSQKLLKRGYG